MAVSHCDSDLCKLQKFKFPNKSEIPSPVQRDGSLSPVTEDISLLLIEVNQIRGAIRWSWAV